MSWLSWMSGNGRRFGRSHRQQRQKRVKGIGRIKGELALSAANGFPPPAACRRGSAGFQPAQAAQPPPVGQELASCPSRAAAASRGAGACLLPVVRRSRLPWGAGAAAASRGAGACLLPVARRPGPPRSPPLSFRPKRRNPFRNWSLRAAKAIRSCRAGVPTPAGRSR